MTMIKISYSIVFIHIFVIKIKANFTVLKL